jgi:trk system potassium uptake protein TrkA
MISEIAPPATFLGKSIGELQLRGKYHIEVIAVRDILADRISMVPAAGYVIRTARPWLC